MSQGRSKEASELLIDAVNRLRTTLGKDHPNTVQAIANLSSIREKCASSQHFLGANESMEVLHDRLLQFAASWSFNEGNDSQERLHKHATEDDDPMTDEERPQLALAMSLKVDDNNDTHEERLQHALPMSIEADEDNETNEERLQRAPAMSIENEDDIDEIGCLKSMSIEVDEDDETNEERLQLAISPEVDDNNDTDEERLRRALAMSIKVDKDNETNEERLQRAIAMPMKDDNDDDDIGCFKREYSSDTTGSRFWT
ncbi:hypothetical protein BDD12DRAFT_939978 [Trichophaea hybrida]|nr:hypothetical protein BDD12DRAFT_939978 [Trichophaea hybrida]